mgnify:CR=1 FL=1|jgi:hypothetical protein
MEQSHTRWAYPTDRSSCRGCCWCMGHEAMNLLCLWAAGVAADKEGSRSFPKDGKDRYHRLQGLSRGGREVCLPLMSTSASHDRPIR